MPQKFGIVGLGGAIGSCKKVVAHRVEQCGGFLVCLFHQLGHGELTGSVNYYKEKELVFGGPEFGDVDMKITDWIPLELLPLRLGPIHVRQA